MANIYLRLPLYLAEFYRGRNPKIQLGRDDVFCFPPQSEEWNIIRNGCAIMDPLKQRDRHCYCQQQWKQLMDGFTIDGKRLMKPFVNGTAIEDIVTMINAIVYNGMLEAKPPYLLISRVCVLS